MTDRMALAGRQIVLGICGGIAAYKAVELARLLGKAGASVQVAMTEAATHFVGATTLQAVTGRPVRSSLWDADAEAAMSHIELARWPDLIVLAPATANTLAKLAHGFADNLLTTLCLATRAPILLAPAMNQVMWLHPANQANLQVLRARGLAVVGPEEGGQACGEIGPGRMSEPESILRAVVEQLA